jgi:hypothetical protein
VFGVGEDLSITKVPSNSGGYNNFEQKIPQSFLELRVRDNEQFFFHLLPHNSKNKQKIMKKEKNIGIL